MSDWTAGYVADIGYTYGYYQELNPLRARLALNYHALVCPRFETACELGFGQGLSTNMHAAASGTEWYGTDFNPSQAGFAQELARVSGNGASLYDEAFAEFCNRPDLPDFDFIGLHGIWSWINDENRKLIVDFVRRKLKVGGVLYVSYNTLPGWATFAPMRHLMTQHSEVIGSEGRGIVSRIDGAIEFAEKLLATNPLFLKANPLIIERIKKMRDQNRHYLAHEYFNRDWHPMHFSTMAGWLEEAKVGFACSAHYLDFVDGVNLSVEQQQFLAEIPDMMLRQSTRDFMVNNQFRRDYWVKGARRLTAREQTDALLEHRVILQAHRPDVSLKVTSTRGEADMNKAIYEPILDCMANHEVRTLGEIAEAVESQGVTRPQVIQAIVVLANNGSVASVQDEEAIGSAQAATDKLNHHIISKADGSDELANLASPVIGGGTPANRFVQLFLAANKEGITGTEELADFAWSRLRAVGQKLVVEGKSLDTDEENLQQLREYAERYVSKQEPIMRALRLK